MPANQVLGLHYYFTPGLSKPGTWIKRGIVDTLQLKPSGEIIEQEGPLPGHMGRIDVIETSRKLDFTVKTKQSDPLFWQLVFNAATLAAGSSVQFNPNGGSLVKGWHKFQGYDQSDVLVLNVEVFGSVRMPSGATLGGKQLTGGDIEGMVIENVLNTGSLYDLI